VVRRCASDNSAADHHCPRGESGVRFQRIERAAKVELKVVTIDAGSATPQHADAHTHPVLAGTGTIVTGEDRQLIGPTQEWGRERRVR
jgi:hypothetical protein